ncbi:LysE/ArgO family amino acid transporter [Rhodoferax sp.]|uniref:LysE/ArgO family amino acid transporter n=1 Tax=Rhodoferax sp. TaxID=50421 RepID=UPI002ACD6666|nr:LysE family transporter [Rhodoferax sp.]MDZ7920096.1 LysE family transporter [Rhodoferax sp.]
MSSSFNVSVFLTGLTLSLSLIMAIGAQNTHVLRQGLRREHVAAVVAVCALLDMALMTLGVSGLAASLGEYPRALDALGFVGALVLVVYGAQALRRALQPSTLQAAHGGAPVSAGRMVAQTLSLSLLNPHVYLDTVILVGAVGAKQPAGSQVAFLLGAGSASALWFVALGYGARVLTPLFAKPIAWRMLDLLVTAMMWTIAAGLVQRSLHL